MMGEHGVGSIAGGIQGLCAPRGGSSRNRPATQVHHDASWSAPRDIRGVRRRLVTEARYKGHLNPTVEPPTAGTTTVRQLDVVA